MLKNQNSKNQILSFFEIFGKEPDKYGLNSNIRNYLEDNNDKRFLDYFNYVSGLLKSIENKDNEIINYYLMDET